jgi:tRNA-Thr(GGU) m(6)t(6)A37 methyltransferase TsaA
VTYEVRVIGRVSSPLTDLENAPMQADEGAPDAWLVFEPGVADAVADIAPGDQLVVMTWLDRADRDVLTVHPRGDPSRPMMGVFSTRSQHRPNPIGLHPVEVLSVEAGRVQVSSLEAIDGTPIIDVKPALSQRISER